jgi:hypothetical protein
MTNTFTETTRLYQSIAASVTRTENYFTTEEYRKLEKASGIAYEKIEPLCTLIIGIMQGKNKGEEIGLTGVEEKICFYTGILQKQPGMLEDNLRATFDEIIQDSFLLGLVSHLYLYDNPSRNEFADVDAAAAMKKLAPALMSSSAKMRKYNKKLNTIPILIFENYYDSRIAQVLNGQLGLGLMKSASARNYFTNLFFGGARFGEMLDNQTREAKCPVIIDGVCYNT